MYPAILLVALLTPAFAQTTFSGSTVATAPRHAEPSVVSLSVAEAVQQAQVQSFRLKRALRAVEAARMREQDVQAQNKPRFDLGFNAGTSWNALRDMKGHDPSQHTVNQNANLSGSIYWQLDISGRIQRQRLVTQLSSESVRMNYQQVLRELEVDVFASYFEILRAQENLAAEELSQKRLAALIQRVPAGKEELRRFLEVELSSGLQALSTNRNSLDLVQNGLLQQLRLPTKTTLRLTTQMRADVPELDSDALLEQAMLERTDLQEARLRVQQAEWAIIQAKDYLKPSANVYAFSWLSHNDSRTRFGDTSRQNWNTGRYSSIMFNLYIPLLQWDGGALNNSERMALMNLEQARDDLQELEERASAELRQMLSSLNQVRQRLRNLPRPEAALEALASAETGLLASEQWESAVAQVSNARHLWRTALSARIDALSDYYAVYFRLQRALGGALAPTTAYESPPPQAVGLSLQ